VLRVGLTGGIGAGKSAASAALARRGALVLDADRLAREVVEPGTAGLAAVVAEFGPEVLRPDGALDRPALGRLVFADDAARARLTGIVHPLVAARTAELLSAAPPGAVVVHDVPLLVENGLGPDYHLVVVVHAPVEDRLARLTEGRGMTEEEARARMAAQADDAARRAAADAELANTADLAALDAAVDVLWRQRLVPYEENVRLARPAPRPEVAAVVPYDPEWPAAAARLAARAARAAGERALRVDHVGPTAVPGLPTRDVVDLQLAVASPADADALAPDLAAAGLPLVAAAAGEPPGPPEAAEPGSGQEAARLHRSADPGRAADLHVRVTGSPGWRSALLLRDWLRADPTARARYEAADALPGEAERWAAATGWTP